MVEGIGLKVTFQEVFYFIHHKLKGVARKKKIEKKYRKKLLKNFFLEK